MPSFTPIRPGSRSPLAGWRAARLAAALVAVWLAQAATAQELSTTAAEAFYRQGKIDLRAGRVVEGEWRLLQALRRDTAHFLAHMDLAELYQAANPELALTHLNVAERLRPSSDQAHFLIGDLLERMGRLMEAADHFRRAVTFNARHYEADRRLKGILRKLRERKTVLERASEQFWRKPSLGALTLYGRVVIQESTPLQALLEFEQLREKLPELPETSLWVARAQNQLGSAEGELAAYRQFLAARPGAHQVRLTLVERFLTLRRHEDANLALAPLAPMLEDSAADPEVRARTAFLLSRTLIGKGDPSAAGAMLVRAGGLGFDPARTGAEFEDHLRRYPEFAPLRLSHAQWLRSQGRYAEAATSYHRAGMLAPALRPGAAAALQELLAQNRSPNETLLGLGEFALAAGKQADAEKLLTRIAPSHPASRQASLQLTVLARRRGDLQASLDRAMRYILSFPDRTGMTFARGKVFWEFGQPEVAEAAWGEDPAVTEHYPETLVHLAEWYRERKDDPAELAARELLRGLEPDRIENHRRLGELYSAARRTEDAVAAWESTVQLSPGDLELRLKLARAEIGLGRRASAIEHLLEAARIGPLPDELTDMLARELTAQRRYAEAIELYWTIYQTRPTHPDLARVMPLLALQVPAAPPVRIAAARIAERQGQTGPAMEILEDVVRRDPEQEEARVMLAGMYLQFGDSEAAERILAVEGGPAALTGALRLHLLAQALIRQRRREDALPVLTRLLEVSPEHAEGRRLLAFALYDLGRKEEALPHLQVLAQASPTDAELVMRTARTEAALGKDGEAVTRLVKLAENQPAYEPGLQLLIERALKTQRWKEAAPGLERWVALHPEDDSSRYNLVVTYLRLQQREAGRPHYETLVARNAAQAPRLESFYK